MWELLIWISLFIISYIVIYFAADLFLDNLKLLCIIYNLSPLIIGMLILGIDPEESIASIISALNGLPYISMGNIIGNSIIAMTLPFAIALMVKPIQVHSIALFYVIFIFILLILVLLGLILDVFFLFSGILALLSYGIYLTWNLKHYSKKEQTLESFAFPRVKNEFELRNPHEVVKYKKVLLIVAGFVFIFLGGELLIFSADKILEIIQISEVFFGFIIIGFVTNVEELTLVVKSIKKEATELGIGGMIGKVIWNLSFTYGISSIIIMNIAFNVILIVNLFILSLIFILYIFFLRSELLKRSHGIVLLLVFLLFLSYNFYVI
jgi:cation:H+ antiporter